MKKKICILGSTGSIGKTTLQILLKNKKDFEVVLLSGNSNVEDRKSTRLNSSHIPLSRMPSSA